MNVFAISLLYGITAFLVVVTISEIRTLRRKRLERKLIRQVVKPEDKKVPGKFKESLNSFLMGAGLNIRFEEFFFTILILYILAFISFLLSGLPIFFAILLSSMLPLLFIWYLRYKKEKRILKAEKQMEGFLIDLSGILAPIPNIIEALKKSTETLEQPLKNEILKVINNVTAANLSLEESLKSLSYRFNDRGLVNVFSIALIQANKIGTKDTGKILKRYADVARRNQRIRAEAHSKLSYSRAQKNILITGIIFMYVLIFILNPDYINFYRTLTGLWIILYSIVSIGIGLYILNRLTNIGSER